MEDRLDIKYLVKIQSHKEYQDNLIKNGNIHANCASYYSDLYIQNPMQGDNKECSLCISSGKINTLKPIFSTIAIEKKDIIKKGNSRFIELPLQMVKDFVDNKAYITIINYKNFIEQLNFYFKQENVSYIHEKVGYCTHISKEFFKDHINNLEIFMFIKHKKYIQQKEYRFVFDDYCKEVFKNIKIDDMIVPERQRILPVDYYIGSIEDYSQTLQIDITNCDTNLLIKVKPNE